jgi:hypothetical protein
MTNNQREDSKGQSKTDIAEADPKDEQKQSSGQSKTDIAEAGPNK